MAVLTGNLLLPAALTTVTVGLWATSLLPDYLVALLFFAAAVILRVAPAEVVFSGFASQAFWLVLSGFVLGAAIRKTGLADRVARLMAAHLAASWPLMVGGTVALSYALAFVMPSNMGRIALLMPIAMALADGATLGARGRTGLALAVGFGTFELSASILPANVPNLVMAGAAERAYAVHLSYLPYLALHAPVLGLLKGAALTAAICRLFPAAPAGDGGPASPAPAGALTPPERRLALLLAATLALWLTDGWHGVAPAWVGLVSACLCLLPRVGVLGGDEFAAGVNLRTCLYIAAILGLAAVVAGSGPGSGPSLGTRIGQALLPLLPLDPARPALSFASLVGLTSVLNFAVTANGVPALYTPLARSLGDAAGLPLATVLMAQVIGYATPLLPYQASPIVVAMGMGNVSVRDGARLCLALAALTFAVLLPLDLLWFRLLGWLP